MDTEEAAVREPGARGPGKFPQPVHFIVCSFMCPTTLWLS